MTSLIPNSSRTVRWTLLGLLLSLAGCSHAPATVEKSAPAKSAPATPAVASATPATTAKSPDPTAAERAAAEQAAQLAAAMGRSPQRPDTGTPSAVANEAASPEPAAPPIRWIETRPAHPMPEGTPAPTPTPAAPVPVKEATSPTPAAPVVPTTPPATPPTTIPATMPANPETATLKVRRVELCRRVRGYGAYDPITASFLAGKDQRVIVYVEVDNFKAVKAGDGGQYQVKLQQEITLYTLADGAEVWKQAPVQILDESRNQRRDFFIVQMVDLPARLTVGKYVLKVRVTDQQGSCVDEASVPVTLVADPGLVKTNPR